MLHFYILLFTTCKLLDFYPEIFDEMPPCHWVHQLFCWNHTRNWQRLTKWGQFLLNIAFAVFCSEELGRLPWKNQNKSLTLSYLVGKFKFAVCWDHIQKRFFLRATFTWKSPNKHRKTFYYNLYTSLIIYYCLSSWDHNASHTS